jgi:hypothetical protein
MERLNTTATVGKPMSLTLFGSGLIPQAIQNGTLPSKILAKQATTERHLWRYVFMAWDRIRTGEYDPAAADFAWPAPFAMEMQSCGRSDAAWSDETRTLRACYELAFDFLQLYRAHVAAAPTPASASPKRNRKSKRFVRRRRY